jgi:hypothetical protein
MGSHYKINTNVELTTIIAHQLHLHKNYSTAARRTLAIDAQPIIASVSTQEQGKVTWFLYGLTNHRHARLEE